MDHFKANPWGLHDMHGNLYQWCQDWHGKDYYDKIDKIDPPGPDSAPARVLRGGCWISDPRVCRAARRFKDAPGYRNDGYGCRVQLRLD